MFYLVFNPVLDHSILEKLTKQKRTYMTQDFNVMLQLHNQGEIQFHLVMPCKNKTSKNLLLSYSDLDRKSLIEKTSCSNKVCYTPTHQYKQHTANSLKHILSFFLCLYATAMKVSSSMAQSPHWAMVLASSLDSSACIHVCPHSAPHRFSMVNGHE